MTTAIQRPLADFAVTPGFFTSCLQDNNEDGGDVFDAAFKTGQKHIRLVQGEHPPDENHHRLDFFHAMDDRSSFDFGYAPPARAFSKAEELLVSSMPWDGLKQEDMSQPSNSPMIQTQVLSPPDSAVEPPTSHDFLQFPGGMRSPLHDILNQERSTRARAQHGQFTPPDDCPSPPHTLYQPSKRKNGSFASSGKPTGNKKRRYTVGDFENSITSPPKRSRKGRGQSKSSIDDMSPVDPDNPDDVKRSKFLERNRVAASKCRQKKKEWTASLESRVRDLQNCRTQLSVVVDSLKEEVLFLKGELLQHTNCGCTRIREYLSQEVNSMTSPHDTFVAKRLESPIVSRPSSPSGS